MEISIRHLLTDPYGNRSTLDVTSDDFGVLQYSLYGTNTHTRESLANLQIPKNVRLPSLVTSVGNSIAESQQQRERGTVLELAGAILNIVEMGIYTCENDFALEI